MFPIFADSFLTAARMTEPRNTPDYRALHPDHRMTKPRGLPKLWYFLS